MVVCACVCVRVEPVVAVDAGGPVSSSQTLTLCGTQRRPSETMAAATNNLGGTAGGGKGTLRLTSGGGSKTLQRGTAMGGASTVGALTAENLGVVAGPGGGGHYSAAGAVSAGQEGADPGFGKRFLPAVAYVVRALGQRAHGRQERDAKLVARRQELLSLLPS